LPQTGEFEGVIFAIGTPGKLLASRGREQNCGNE
jgi:hypothetical protein